MSVYPHKMEKTTNKHCVNPYKEARELCGMTQEYAASKLFISVRYLQDFESGRRKPKRDIRQRMAALYDMPAVGADPESPAFVGTVVLKELRDFAALADELHDITYDDVVTPDQRERFEKIQKEGLELAAGLHVLAGI